MIRNKKALIAAVLGAAALTAPTLSVAQQQAPERATYLGLSAGRADYKSTCDGVTVPCDNSDTAWRFFGGYQFSRTFAAEFGYSNLGAASGSGGGLSMRYEVFAWDLTGVFMIPVSPSFSFLAKAGMYRAEVESRGNVDRFQGNGNDKGTGITIGFGGQFNLGRNLGLRLEWNRLGNVGGPSVGGEDDINVLTAGALWKF